jgi:hypothetical protein
MCTKRSVDGRFEVGSRLRTCRHHRIRVCGDEGLGSARLGMSADGHDFALHRARRTPVGTRVMCIVSPLDSEDLPFLPAEIDREDHMKRAAIATMLVSVSTLIGIGSARASASQAQRACGTITWHEAGFAFHDRIYVRRGRVSCAKARNVLYDAYASPPAYGGWRMAVPVSRAATRLCDLQPARQRDLRPRDLTVAA